MIAGQADTGGDFVHMPAQCPEHAQGVPDIGGLAKKPSLTCHHGVTAEHDAAGMARGDGHGFEGGVLDSDLVRRVTSFHFIDSRNVDKEVEACGRKQFAAPR
ncbi:MAG: hypothetical protein Fur0032_04220 [Terrimicrobiaceae bacterium]